jgi:DNA-binding CsgD family transcriptional regulator
VLAGRFAAPGGTLADICQAALAAPQPPVVRTCDLLLEGLATAVVHGRIAAAPALRAAVDVFMTNQASEEDWINWGRHAASAAFILWDYESWAELSGRQISRARESGALASLVLALNGHANVTTLRGDLDSAAALVAEQRAVKEVTGIRMASYGGRELAAYQGRPDDMAALDEEPIEPGDGYAMDVADLALAILNNGLCRYTDALSAARSVSPSSWFQPFAIVELVEAAARTGEVELAVEGLDKLTSMVVAGSDWAAAVEARCRALVSTGPAAERCYEESITCLARTPLRIELGRSQLLFGEWLRRDHRRAESREHLRRAYQLFSETGAAAFAERARSELQATGETVRRRDVTTQLDLTPQEEHIARLARDGRSNPEIGSELFISPRTVEWHLRKVFAKLNISSRSALRDALPPIRGS